MRTWSQVARRPGWPWYQTAAVAGLVAAPMLAVGQASEALSLAGLLAVAAGIVAVVEGMRRDHGADPSRLIPGALGVLTVAAGALCLLGVLAGGAHR